MAKAKSNCFVPGYKDGDGIILYTDCISSSEKDAIRKATDSIECGDSEDLIVFELVPRYRVKQAQVSVEEL